MHLCKNKTLIHLRFANLRCTIYKHWRDFYEQTATPYCHQSAAKIHSHNYIKPTSVYNPAKPMTTRADKEFYSAHRASLSLRHSVRNAHLPYASRPHKHSESIHTSINKTNPLSLYQTVRGRESTPLRPRAYRDPASVRVPDSTNRLA